MRVVFMGTPSFAVPSLDALLAGYEVVAAYTRPDRGAGRGRHVTSSPVKRRALEAGVPVEQPASLRDPEATERLIAFRPDVIVVAAYGAILPADVIDLPPLGCVNVHASLLPRWRGAAPIQRAVLAGDELAGVSIMRMETGLDTGPWCTQVSTPVDAKTSAELTDELALLGADSLIAALPAIATGKAVWLPQDEAAVTYADKLTAAHVALDPALAVEAALRRVRASGPSAPCRATIGGRRVTIVSARAVDASVREGSVSTETGLVLGLADGSILIGALVPEGRAAMAATDWLRGARLAPDSHWSAS